MSRTTLCIATAGVLIALSSGMMLARRIALGDEVRFPGGPGTWKVRMLARGKSTRPDARLITALPQNHGRQKIFNDSFRSAELQPRPPDLKHPEKRFVVWTPLPSAALGSFETHIEFIATLDSNHASIESLGDDPSLVGHFLKTNAKSGREQQAVAERARELTAGVETLSDQAKALFRFVDEEITTDPTLAGPSQSPAHCLANGSGDAGAKSRLLIAMLRHHEISARLVSGLTLTKGHEQLAHHWVEAWLTDKWIAMCPVYHHFGRVPPTFLTFTSGDVPIVRGRHIRDLDYAFLIEKQPGLDLATDPSAARRFFRTMSFHALPHAEQQLVGFLLMLPLAALVVCVFRNVIGLQSFGTFAPALIGLAFRDFFSITGLLLFLCILLVGWLVRRVLDRYHLLQVPRQAFMLSIVVLILIGAIFLANSRSGTANTTQYVSLFPLVILTGMIERFWTLETEDSTAASFRTLLSTIVIATSIGVLLSVPPLVRQFYRYPEIVGVVMAGQLLLGRYTGYRLSELIRFRDLVRPQMASAE